MDNKNKQKIVALIVTILSLIASTLGCIFGVTTDNLQAVETASHYQSL